jgi:hypothetical protein
MRIPAIFGCGVGPSNAASGRPGGEQLEQAGVDVCPDPTDGLSMKTPIAVALLLASGLLVVQAELNKASESPTNAGFAAVKISLSTTAATNSSAGSEDVKEQQLQNQGESAVRSELITKAPPSKARGVLELFNPFAPAPPQPKSRWIERTDWGTTASRAGSTTPVEVRHEARFGFVAASR